MINALGAMLGWPGFLSASNYFAQKFQKGQSPPCPRRGGRDIKKDAAKPPCIGADGAVRSTTA
jgi:hypothetical protein